MTIKISSLVFLAKGKYPCRVVMREISDPASKVRSQITNRLCYFLSKKLDSIIFQTNWERKCYPKSLQSIGKVIPNPVDIKHEWKGPSKNQVIFAMGRMLNTQKRFDVLLKAFKIFLEKQPNFKLHLYGDGPDMCKIQRIAKDLGIYRNVIFFGAKHDVIKYALDAQMFVMTSDFEGMSNALLESFLSGIPCISTDWPGVEDVIENNKDGIIVQRDNPLILSNAMSNLANNFDLQEKFSKNAKLKREKFASSYVFKLYCNVIEGNNLK